MDYQDPVKANGKMGRVLVVDDVAVVRKSIRTTLANAGYEVLEAENGEQAVEIVQASGGRHPVNAILSDLRMPQINGVELIACFRRRYPAIPIVALTTYPDVELAVSLMRQGVMDFLVKPVLQGELLEVIGRAVAQNAAPNDRVVSYKELRQGKENELGRVPG
mgnify:CR=1 FL=1